MSSKTRLIKIASEINIGKDTILEYLSSKGFKVENKLTAVLTEEMVDVVLDKFKVEKSNAAKQREAILQAKTKKSSKDDSEYFESEVNEEHVSHSTPDLFTSAPEIEVIPVVKKEEVVEEVKAKVTKKVAETIIEEKSLPIPKEKNEKIEEKKDELFVSESKEDRKIESKISIASSENLKEDTLPKVGEIINLSNISRGNEQKKHSTSKSKTSKTDTKKDEAKKGEKSSTRGNGKYSESKEVRQKTNEKKKAESKKKLENQEEKVALASIKTKQKKSSSAGNQSDNTNKKTEKLVATKQPKIEKKVEKDTEKVAVSKTNNDTKNIKDVKIKEIATAISVKAQTDDLKSKDSDVDTDNKGDAKNKDKAGDDRKPGDTIDLKGLTVLGKIEIKKPQKSNSAQNDKQLYAEKSFRARRGDKNKSNNNEKGGQRKYNNRDGGDNRRPLTDNDRNNGNQRQTGTYHTYRNDRKDGQGGQGQQGSNYRRDYSQNNNDNRGFNNQNRDNRQAGGQQQRPIGQRPNDNRAGGQRFTDNRKEGGVDNRYKQNNNNFQVSVGRISEKKIFTNDAPPRGSVASRFNNFEDRRKKRKTLKDSNVPFDVDKAIRDTLIGMEDTGLGSKKAKIKQKKKQEREEKETRQLELAAKEARTLQLSEFVTTSDLAAMVNIKPNDIILKCMQLGLMVTINQRLDKDTIMLIADDYGFEVEFIDDNSVEYVIDEEFDDETALQPRPPIVTIMGHVDHGKTSLLDHIRNTNVVAGEAGGITQHIGAYRVILKNGKSITFLDTPGHEAFTAMRARGAQVTDIVVIVVAADDSVMPQTIEAISHAKAANVPIIVAINKIDKPESNVDRIKQQLSERGILVEDWGGKFQCAEISAKKGINIDVLLDKILLEAEMLELKANPDRNAQGVVIESKMTKGWGNVASVVIQKGTLFLQDYFVAGANYGRIRALLDERGNKVEDVLPSQPVVVIGFDGLPDAGDTFMVCDTEAEAREIATRRKQLRREQALRKVHHTTLDDISAQISIGGVKDLNLVIKGDVAGSVEALGDSLLKLSTEEVRVNIVYKAAGIISESDVMLAAASSAVVIGFNISSTPQASRLAEEETVEIRHYNIIYDTINDIHLALEGMLKPDIKEEISALVEVRQIFKISKVGQIAGCYVTSGKISRNDKIRIIRNGFPIFSSLISSLKRNKDDAKEVDTNYECGIQVSNFNDFEVGDIIEAIKIVEIKRTLDK